MPHTPTPWRVANEKTSQPQIASGRTHVADVPSKADASLIVRAVNAHDALVSALDEITIAECESCEGTGHEGADTAEDEACHSCGGYGEYIRSGDPNHIRDALKLAKGE